MTPAARPSGGIPLLDGRRLARASAAAATLLAVVLLGALLLNPRAFESDSAPQLRASRAAAVLLGGGAPVERAIVWRDRAPRVALAALVGAALALAGALLQLLLRNPLADPFVLGVSSGAALASVLAIAAGASLGGVGRPAAAALGALGAAVLVQRLARDRDGRLSTDRMVLAGVVLSYVLAAGVMWVISLAPAQQGQRYLFWLMGSVATASGRDVLALGVLLAVASAGAVPLLSSLNLLAVAEDHAADSGVSVERVKWLTFAVAALLVGGAVATAGSIGFVGLVVPHAARLVLGADSRWAPVVAMTGAAFLVVVDAAARLLGEMPLGVITATCGGPFFLWLLARRAS